MYKKFLKSILFATVATFSISTVVNAKPIPKNATPTQIFKGWSTSSYTSKDIEVALKKEQPNVMGFVAYTHFIGYDQGNKTYSIDKSYRYAKKAAAKNDALGKYTLGMIYVQGYKQKNGLSLYDSKLKGFELVKQACLEGRLLEKIHYSVNVIEDCSTLEANYKK